MRFFQLSDLHIGKQLHGYSMSEDQTLILRQIVWEIREKKPDAVLISGDIYDKSVPSAEAVSIFDEFLTGISEITPQIPVLIIAGNHDSGERIDFANTILARHQVFIAGMPPRTEEERMRKVTLADEYGPVDFYLLPFVKPSMVRRLFPEEENLTYDLAVKLMIARENIDTSRRNVILSHQFYVSRGERPESSESEVKSVGGIDDVDTSALEAFDYAALGHIHKPQRIGKENFRYCGTPLKYSVSEVGQEKGILMVELKEKGASPIITKIPLTPLREVRELRGSMETILSLATEENREDYVSITLTDEKEPYRVMDQLSDVYSHILELRVDNSRTRSILNEELNEEEITDPYEIFQKFFSEVQGRPLDEQEKEAVSEVIQEALQWGNNE